MATSIIGLILVVLGIYTIFSTDMAKSFTEETMSFHNFPLRVRQVLTVKLDGVMKSIQIQEILFSKKLIGNSTFEYNIIITYREAATGLTGVVSVANLHELQELGFYR